LRPAKSEEGPGDRLNNIFVRGMREKKFSKRGKRRRWEGSANGVTEGKKRIYCRPIDGSISLN